MNEEQMKKWVDDVIEHWRKYGEESGTYAALSWLKARVTALEAEKQASDSIALKREIGYAIDGEKAALSV